MIVTAASSIVFAVASHGHHRVTFDCWPVRHHRVECVIVHPHHRPSTPVRTVPTDPQSSPNATQPVTPSNPLSSFDTTGNDAQRESEAEAYELEHLPECTLAIAEAAESCEGEVPTE